MAQDRSDPEPRPTYFQSVGFRQRLARTFAKEATKSVLNGPPDRIMYWIVSAFVLGASNVWWLLDPALTRSIIRSEAEIQTPALILVCQATQARFDSCRPKIEGETRYAMPTACAGEQGMSVCNTAGRELLRRYLVLLTSTSTMAADRPAESIGGMVLPGRLWEWQGSVRRRTKT